MTNFDIDNWEELQPYKDYNYDLIDKEYPIDENNASSTYNQFIQLRDTLVFSWKKYKWKAWSKLVVWEKEETIEIEYNNIYRMLFNSMTDSTPTIESKWPYVEYSREAADIYWEICCVIKKDWRYRIVHKEEVLPTVSETKVLTYVDIIRNWQYLLVWGVAVFDMEVGWTLNWTTSGTEPNWTCSISFSLWKLFQKLTAFGYIERDLKAWDILVLRAMDEEPDPDGSPASLWYKLHLQSNSNFFSVEYINLPYNN